HDGPGLDASCFRPWLEPLRKVGDLTVYTQKAPTMDLLVEELQAICDALQGPRVLLAHGFGAALALETLRRHPNLDVRALILVDWLYDSAGKGFFGFYSEDDLESALDPSDNADSKFRQEIVEMG